MRPPVLRRALLGVGRAARWPQGTARWRRGRGEIRRTGASGSGDRVPASVITYLTGPVSNLNPEAGCRIFFSRRPSLSRSCPPRGHTSPFVLGDAVRSSILALNKGQLFISALFVNLRLSGSGGFLPWLGRRETFPSSSSDEEGDDHSSSRQEYDPIPCLMSYLKLHFASRSSYQSPIPISISHRIPYFKTSLSTSLF